MFTVFGDNPEPYIFLSIDITTTLLPASGSIAFKSYNVVVLLNKDCDVGLSYRTGSLGFRLLPVVVVKFLIVPDTNVDCS